MDTYADTMDYRAVPAGGTSRAGAWAGPAGVCVPAAAGDVAVNAESRTFWDGDDLVSILSVHTLVCPLIRAELRGDGCVRVLAYYHASTRLGLQAYEAVLRDGTAVQEQLGLRRFLQHTLKLPDTCANLHAPAIREMYLHEIIRHLSQAIAACRLEPNDEFAVARII